MEALEKSAMTKKVTPFNIAEHLETEADIQAFLNETAQQGNASDFVHALGIAARAKGMSEVAKQAGVTRASLYKSLADDGNPHFDTIFRVCNALGVQLVTQPIHA